MRSGLVILKKMSLRAGGTCKRNGVESVKNESSVRELWLDVLRAAAACAVVLMHTVTGSVDIMNTGQYSQGRLLLIIMDLVTWCVPVFLMISGYLFLNPKKEISFQKMLRKYCLRIVLALLVFGIPFSCLELILAERRLRIGMLWDGLVMVCTMRSWSHLWYLYLILMLFLLTPAMKWFLKKMPDWTVVIVAVILVVGSSILPFVNKLLGTQLPMLSEQLIYVFYYLFGHFLHKKRENAGEGKELWGMCAVSALLVAGATCYRIIGKDTIQMAYNFPPTVLLSVCLMRIGQCMYCRGQGKCNERKQKVIMGLANLSFGIYMIHPVFLNLSYKFLHITPMDYSLAWSLPLFWGAVMLCSIVSTWIMRKITPLRRYVL